MRDLIEQIIKEKYQLQELSKKTLGRYVGKAAGDLANKSFEHGLSTQTNHPKRKEFMRKAQNREDGLKRASKKITNEDILQELSRKTLASYVGKAADSLDDSATKSARHGEHAKDRYHLGKEIAGLHSKWAGEHAATATKRKFGLKQAVKKLTKEESLQEISDNTLRSYSQKASDDVLNLSGRAISARKRAAENAKQGNFNSKAKDDHEKIVKRMLKRSEGMSLARTKLSRPKHTWNNK